ncbi:MAG: hypothetical protein RMK64_12210 [Rhodovarius sp.]|nr:hypothetical protein [Rhodovarius sp.]MDW8315728.1 hypothetical protein [Rhodovarius sp.]
MTRDSLFVLTVGTCLLHGLFSPALIYVIFFHPVWLPELLPATAEIVFYGASLIISTATLLLAALPAALAERLGLSLDAAMRIWFGAAVAITAFALLQR